MEGQEIKKIAMRQKVLLLCILGYICVIIVQFMVPEEVKLIPALVGLGISIVASVFVFMLAIKLYGTGVGVLLGILTLIPLIGLISLLSVNGKATRILQENGIRVGLLGAKNL